MVQARGPTGIPDNGWYPGELQFRQFNKSGKYYPSSKLNYLAAPQSTGYIKNDNKFPKPIQSDGPYSFYG